MTVYNGTSADDLYNGGESSDTIRGAAGNDSLTGNGGFDLIEGGMGADTLIGGDGDDALASYLADDELGEYPYASSSSLDIYAEHDVLSGGEGDDYIAAGFGDDVDGGAGGNYLYINLQGATSGVDADFSKLKTEGSITIGGGLIENMNEFAHVIGSEFGDYIRAGSGIYSSNTVHGAGGDDTLVASYYTSLVFGDAGNDTIEGADGLAELFGGDGDDTINGIGDWKSFGEDGDDLIRTDGKAYGGDGADTLELGSFWEGGSGYGEAGDDLIFVADPTRFEPAFMVGGLGNDTLTGGAGADQLYSEAYVEFTRTGVDFGAKRDILSAGGGADTLSAGYGDDVDGGAGVDRLTLSWAGATSGVRLKTSQILSGKADFGGGEVKNVEALDALWFSEHGDHVTATQQPGVQFIHGQGGDDQLIGSGSAVELFGGDGDDTLAAGAGGDNLDGGEGNDVFVIGMTGVRVLERNQDGEDTVRSSINYELGTNLERLVLVGKAREGLGNLSDNVITGNGFANTLFGGSGDDTLAGGVGGDEMAGNRGSDVFVVDSTGDKVIEQADQGFDTVRSSVTHTLRANVEALQLTGGEAIDGSGNGEANVVSGNAAANRLEGRGGADTLTGRDGDDRLDGGIGADQMSGGLGDDIYIVDKSSDQVLEARDHGVDTVESSVAFVLGANVENLVLTGINGVSATGNGQDNTIHGNDGANRIGGGLGGDQLFGGAGGDTFTYEVVRDSDALRTDFLADFAAEDRLDLSAVDANARSEANDAFVRLAGDGAFTAAGQFRLTFDGIETLLELNVDKDAEAEMVIRLAGDHTGAGATDGWIL